ncbi:MAG: hypothetical protein R3B13_02200 [Polyangiaceae bacterium]
MKRWLGRAPFFLLIPFGACRPEPRSQPLRLAAAPPVGPRGNPAALAPGETGLVRCENVTCRSDSETCCVYSNISRCSPNVPNTQNLPRSQGMACSESFNDSALETFRRCDDSSDCGAGASCCRMFIASGAAGDWCVPSPDPQSSPCDFNELCVTAGTCHTPGARCIGGVCKKPIDVQCGAVRCSAPNSECCGNPPSCKTPEACVHQTTFRCAHPSDCLPGEHCAENVVGTECTQFLDIANTATVCDTTADCGPPDAICSHYVCKPSPLSWLQTCQCP